MFNDGPRSHVPNSRRHELIKGCIVRFVNTTDIVYKVLAGIDRFIPPLEDYLDM